MDIALTVPIFLDSSHACLATCSSTFILVVITNTDVVFEVVTSTMFMMRRIISGTVVNLH